MSEFTIYHNTRCSKSREALQLLNDQGVDPVIVEYLKEVPTRAEFKKLLAKLNLKPAQVLRTSEPIFKEKYKGKNFTDDEWITIMLETPQLIERPIVVKGNKAIIARPPESIDQFFE
ncbi:MAG: arsenate reductase (glutaredoxin) [Bacteroidota bacterium]